MRQLKIGHFVNFSPNSCGMFHTAKDTVLAEREVGIDSQMIDWGYAKNYQQRYSRVGLTHEGVTTIAPQWAIDKADILVLHSALPDFVKNCGKPIVVAIHGRPEYSFVLEKMKKGSCLNLWHKFSKDPQVVLFYTYWKEHLDYWNMILKKPVDYIPAMVDLRIFHPGEPKVEFKGSGKPNILIADIWREDTSPFNIVFAAAKFIKEHCPDGRIHIYGLSNPNETSAMANILNPLKERNIIGDIHGLVKNINEVYRTADMLITPHNIATRVVREALASGCPIVAGTGSRYTAYQADPHSIPAFMQAIKRCWEQIQGQSNLRGLCREVAEQEFNLKQAGESLEKIYKAILKNRPKKKKKSIKKRNYKIYNFIAYTTPEEEKNLGKAYNRYMEILPNDNDWVCFLDHDAMFTTSDWHHQLYDIIDANPEYSCFTAITNRIGNPDQRFAGINQDNHDIVYHREIGKKAQEQFCIVVKDITDKQLLSGVMILVQKSAWKKAGKFPECGFLGVDNYFDKAIRKEGMKTGVAKGIYLYHWYRFRNCKLKPIM